MLKDRSSGRLFFSLNKTEKHLKTFLVREGPEEERHLLQGREAGLQCQSLGDCLHRMEKDGVGNWNCQVQTNQAPLKEEPRGWTKGRLTALQC